MVIISTNAEILVPFLKMLDINYFFDTSLRSLKIIRNFGKPLKFVHNVL